MSDFEYADQISVQGLTLQGADLAEEEADSEIGFEVRHQEAGGGLCEGNGERLLSEIPSSITRQQTERLVDHLRGRSPLISRHIV